MVEILEKEMKAAPKSKDRHCYQVSKDEEGHYFIHCGDMIKKIIPNEDGSFHVDSKDYESFAQIKLGILVQKSEIK